MLGETIAVLLPQRMHRASYTQSWNADTPHYTPVPRLHYLSCIAQITKLVQVHALIGEFSLQSYRHTRSASAGGTRYARAESSAPHTKPKSVDLSVSAHHCSTGSNVPQALGPSTFGDHPLRHLRHPSASKARVRFQDQTLSGVGIQHSHGTDSQPGSEQVVCCN